MAVLPGVHVAGLTGHQAHMHTAAFLLANSVQTQLGNVAVLKINEAIFQIRQAACIHGPSTLLPDGTQHHGAPQVLKHHLLFDLLVPVAL